MLYFVDFNKKTLILVLVPAATPTLVAAGGPTALIPAPVVPRASSKGRLLRNLLRERPGLLRRLLRRKRLKKQQKVVPVIPALPANIGTGRRNPAEATGIRKGIGTLY